MAALLRDDPGAVLVRGAGTKATWGNAPQRVDVELDMTGCCGVVEHVAGDLVVTVRAGTPLEALDEVLRAAGQRLSVDPVVGPAATTKGTVGGLVATAASGPLRLSAGAVRDLIIGVRFVRADGTAAKAGGKVVKNVAGYDLCKLLTGSFGTLAVITEATFRLHPRPAAERYVAAGLDDVTELTAAAIEPAALELDWSAGEGGGVVALLEGTEEGVRERAAAAASLVGAVEVGRPGWWASPPWPVGGTGLRCTFALSGRDRLLEALAATGLPWRVRGSAAVGVLHAGAPAGDDAGVARAVDQLRAEADRWSGQVVVLEAPDAVRGAVDVWGPAGGLELMRRVKHRFDPDRRLAPGRFVGGI